ncbi:MAG: 5-(carboxyamino)imidazole ribonucleotide synthase [Bdellovibrionales bacterium]|nr:5-(carboxyamino)imidazole ribonucleotide synthase [Bdellovibrionales bacterium]
MWPDLKGKFTRSRIAILGNGQLGRMLALAAHNLGMVPSVYPARSDSSAAQVVPSAPGESLEHFAQEADVLIFENEFVDTEPLAPFAHKCFPGLSAMRVLQDKSAQKLQLSQLQIPTAPYTVYESDQSVQVWLRSLRERFAEGCVIKWGKQGYDGRGLHFLTGVSDAETERFVEKGLAYGPVYAEALVPFTKELALVACRSKNGEFAAYPLLTTEQREGICHVVYGPAAEFGIDHVLDEQVSNWAKRLAVSLDLVGCFALECFLTKSGEVLVNEIAPRVHNSGHFTQDAAATSQFENHLRAVLGLALGSTETAPAFLMVNVLGPATVEARGPVALPTPFPGAHLHWYGKHGIRRGRKLGHINAAAQSADEVPRLRQAVEEMIREWEETLIHG